MIIRFDKAYHITTNKMCHQCNVYFPLYLGNCLINMYVPQKTVLSPPISQILLPTHVTWIHLVQFVRIDLSKVWKFLLLSK